MKKKCNTTHVFITEGQPSDMTVEIKSKCECMKNPIRPSKKGFLTNEINATANKLSIVY